MRRTILLLLLVAVPALAQAPSSSYQIEKEGRVHSTTRTHDGKSTLFVTVQFKITRPGGDLAADVAKDEIVIEEDGRRVTELEIQQPTVLDRLSAVLALDTSGSMAEGGKMDQAKQAARSFLDQLHERADCGLILFNHTLHDTVPPGGGRGRLRSSVEAAAPAGGTAYLDATARAVEMLHNRPGRRAVVVLTDGVDLNSKHALGEVIALAKAAGVPVYTVGVGEPGKNEPVTTVLVLDQSGSMKFPANDEDRIPKIEALHHAASRFVELMRPGAKTTLLPFDNNIEPPEPFTDDKADLIKRIVQLEPAGGTRLYDATYTAIEALDEADPPGKRAVLVLTDGVDEQPRSRHSVRQVIERARRAKLPLHMLGFGRPGDINEEVMARLAEETGGTYHHARTRQQLFEIFEDLSIRLHDDGIDEPALKRLADETGGKYFPARDIAQLRLIYAALAEELQSTYTVTFPSRRQSHDGTSRGIDISVVRKGVRLSDVARFDYNVRGLVVPDLDYGVYLGLLAVLGGLLLLPAGMRWVVRPNGSA